MTADLQDPPPHVGDVVRACSSAGTSSSTRRPRSSSPARSGGTAKPVRPLGRRADARVFPPTTSRCF